MSMLPPDILAQQQDLTRQQRMAELLMGQGMQQPQGQMVSGQYVAPSFFQNLVPVANMLASQRMSDRADKRSLALAKELRGRYADELKQYQEMMNPAPTLAPEQAGPALNAQGQAVPIAREMIETKPDRLAANLVAANAYNPALQAVGMRELTKGPKWEKAEFVDEKTGTTKQGVINVNADNPISTLIVGGVKPALTEKEKQSLQIQRENLNLARAANNRANQQFYFDTGMQVGGGGMPAQGGMPVQGGMPQVNMPAQGGMPQGGNRNISYEPASLPQFEPNPMLTPADNKKAAGLFYEDQRKSSKTAKAAFDSMRDAAALLNSNAPSSGRIENIATGIGEMFGSDSKSSQADLRLQVLGGLLTSQQPRFEGPQSNIDVEMYKTMAGRVGDANLPIKTRLAAIEQMKALQKKYYPNGDWDSIDTGGPIVKPNALGGKRFGTALSGEDRQAYNWAKQNPKSPEAAEILRRLGVD